MNNFFETDHFSISSRNHFSANVLNRLSLQRDEAWEETYHDANSWFVPVCEMKHAVFQGNTKDIVLINGNQFEHLKEANKTICLLGEFKDQFYFSLGLENNDLLDELFPDEKIEWKSLRQLRGMFSEFNASLLANSAGMTYWHHTHRFCGICGHLTLPSKAGYQLTCSNEACKKHHFPQINPAIIVLPIKDDNCILGHNKIWPPNRYSCIAGFMEPGESMEDTVKREVFEEIGIQLGKIRYHSSQPWPFPAGLMLGFHAEALDTNFAFHDKELADAIWMDRDTLEKKLKKKEIFLPDQISISYRLIEHWFNVDGRELGQLVTGF